jgi:hypothetical protein
MAGRPEGGDVEHNHFKEALSWIEFFEGGDWNL